MDTTARLRDETCERGSPFAANDNMCTRLAAPRAYEGAVARIYRPSRSVATSGTARTRRWLLVFEPRFAPFVDPLMGWTGSRDTLTQVELSFPTLDAAVSYAERQGLRYVVQSAPDAVGDMQDIATPAAKHEFSDAMMDRLGMGSLQQEYARALHETDARSDFETAPMDVVRNPHLSREQKREMLMKWAWDEYLAQEMFGRTTESSRMQEVERAIVALDGEGADATCGPSDTKLVA